MTSTSTAPAPKLTRAAYYFILVTVGFDFLAFGIIAPVFPNLIAQFEANNLSRAASVYGWFTFAWAAMQFLFSPILGALSDRYGRRPVILLSCFGLGFDYILMALAPSLSWLFLGRLISGITTSNISTAYAYITDLTAPEERTKKFGTLSAVFGLGFVIGPALGGMLGHYNLRLPFWVAAGLSLANALYGVFVLPESLPPHLRSKSVWNMANPFASLALLRSNRILGGLSIVSFLYYLAHNSLPVVFVFYAEYRYGWTPFWVGISFAVVGVSIAIVSGGLVGPYVKRFGERYSLLSGLLFGTLAFLGFAIAYRGWAFMAAVPLIALWGVANPAMNSIMSRFVDPTSQGKLQGAISSIRALTSMPAPIVFSQIFAMAISPTARFHVPGAPYFLASALLFASCLLAAYVTRNYTPAPGKPISEVNPAESQLAEVQE